MNWKLFVCLASAALLFAPTGAWGTPDTGVSLPDCMLCYKHGPERNVIVVEKSTQSLFVYSNYQPKPLEHYTVTTGRKKGQKEREGDMKTPEGIYFFRRVLTGDQLPKVDDYGEKAFTMNYPNPVDRKEDRLGSGIWLHGAHDSNKTTNPNNSRGCVVMQNGDIIKVAKYLFLNQTPIIVYDKIRFETEANLRKKRDRLIGYIKDWKTNWENKNIDGYIRYYDSDYRQDGMDVKAFKSYKNLLNKKYRFIKVSLSDINLFGYKDYFVVFFHQLYISDINHFYNKKIQYWRIYDNISRIADEYTFRLPGINKFEVSKGNYVSINKFRKDYLRTMKEGTLSIEPHTLRLRKLSVFKEKVTLKLGGSTCRDLKVIPVLRTGQESGGQYITLEGVTLRDGVPEGYKGGVSLDRNPTNVVIKKTEEQSLRSLTLFLVGRGEKLQQIVTYFLDNQTSGSR